MSVSSNSFQFYPLNKLNENESINMDGDYNKLNNVNQSTPNSSKFAKMNFGDCTPSYDEVSQFPKNLQTYSDKPRPDNSDKEGLTSATTSIFETSLKRYENVSNVDNHYFFDETVEGFTDEEEIEREFQEICDDITLPIDEDAMSASIFTSEITIPNVVHLVQNSSVQHDFLIEEETQHGDTCKFSVCHDDTSSPPSTVSERVVFFDTLTRHNAGFQISHYSSKNNFLNLLKTAKEVGPATISTIYSAQKVNDEEESTRWRSNLDIQIPSLEVTPTATEKRIKTLNTRPSTISRKGNTLRKKGNTDKSLNTIQRSNSGRTNIKMHTMMDDLSLVLPVKLRIAEYENRIAKEN